MYIVGRLEKAITADQDIDNAVHDLRDEDSHEDEDEDVVEHAKPMPGKHNLKKIKDGEGEEDFDEEPDRFHHKKSGRQTWKRRWGKVANHMKGKGKRGKGSEGTVRIHAKTTGKVHMPHRKYAMKWARLTMTKKFNRTSSEESVGHGFPGKHRPHHKHPEHKAQHGRSAHRRPGNQRRHLWSQVGGFL